MRKEENLKRRRKTIIVSSVIAVILIVLIILLAIKLRKVENGNNDKNENILKDENEIENIAKEYEVNNIIEEKIKDDEEEKENEIKDDDTEEKDKEEEKVADPKQEVDKQTIKKQESSKEKALNIAKKDWGKDSTVYFSFEGTDDGKYIVSVREIKTTHTLRTYKIDVNSETFETGL